MANFWQDIVAVFNAIIETTSNYVHNDLAFVIDTELARMVKYCTDETVIIIRDILDIFGR